MTLFKTQQELLEILPNTKNVEFSKLTPYLEQAAESVLAGYIGDALYNRILSKYNNGPILSGQEASLLHRIRLVVSKIGLALYLPIGEVAIGNDGITTTGKGTDRTAAYDNQVSRLAESLYQQAFDAIERLLSWLQIQDQLTAFPEYANSEQYSRQQRGLVRRAVDFSDIYPIGGSRLTFQAIHPELINVEEDLLLPLMGSMHYDTIKNSTSLSADYTKLKRQAQKAVVFQAVANVIRLQQSIQLDSGGLRVYQTSQNGSQNVKYYRAPTDGERSQAAAAAQSRADFYFDAVSSTIADIDNPGGYNYEREFLTTGKIAMF